MHKPGESMKIPAVLLLLLLVSANLLSQTAPRPRARDLGVPFEGTPGALNAITDVKGVEVGHSTIIRGEGPLQVGTGPVRTGVTAVLPRGKNWNDGVFAGYFAQNGNGEMTGTIWVEESGFLEGPIMITNTHSVGVVRDAVIQWRLQHSDPGAQPWMLPVVAETYDGFLNDVNGFHVKPQHALEAIDSAHAGPVMEGSVGGGTGMTCNGFKGGIGTASRKLTEQQGGYTVGVLVQCNYGNRRTLRIAGVPIGQEIPQAQPMRRDLGSIIIIVATDAPLVAHQLKRIARRATLGIGRLGAYSGNGSGDIFIAFSTANPGAFASKTASNVTMLPNDRLDPVFEATVQATEEAVVNAMVAADTMTGRDGHTVIGLPHDQLRQALKKYNRLAETTGHRP
jgi:D-aminopeptidase